MRIAYLIHSLHRHGGIERGLTFKVNYLADVFGYDIHIVTACLNGRKTAFQLSEKVKVHDMGANENHPFSSYSRKLNDALKEIAPDIAIAIGDNQMKALLDSDVHCKKFSEFRFSHEKYYMKYGSIFLGRIYAEFRTRRVENLAAKFDEFIVLTEADRKNWERAVPRVCYISNPITFRHPFISEGIKKRCIAVGRLENQKNFDDAIDVWTEVAAKHPDWSLDIFGEGTQRKHLQRKITDMGLEEKVILKGNSNDIIDEMNDSYLIVMTSKFEGHPQVLLEASEIGLPLVSYDCPKGPAEIIHDGENGFLLPFGDKKGVADAVCRLIEDKNLRDRMGAKSKEYASRYDMDTIMSKWKKLFEESI